MNIKEKIEGNKTKILPELFSWAETFNPENIIYDKYIMNQDDEEGLDKSYQFILDLLHRLENSQCSIKDYTDILFHIEQINHNEIKIQL